MIRSKTIPPLTVALCFVATVFATERAEARVSVNGYELSPLQVELLERQLGVRLAAGAYLVDPDGCWVNLANGARGCLQSSFEYQSRHGSGAQSADGTWNHWSDAAGGGVGGTADGCV